MLDRMTDAARCLVVESRTEAELLGHAHVGTEHLMLAAVGNPEWVSYQVIVRELPDPDRMRRALKAVLRPGPGASALAGVKIAFTSEAKGAIEVAARVAKELGHSCVGTGHLLVAALLDDGASWAPVLAALGVDADEARRSVADLHPLSDELRDTDIRPANRHRPATSANVGFAPRAWVEAARAEGLRRGDPVDERLAATAAGRSANVAPFAGTTGWDARDAEISELRREVYQLRQIISELSGRVEAIDGIRTRTYTL